MKNEPLNSWSKRSEEVTSTPTSIQLPRSEFQLFPRDFVITDAKRCSVRGDDLTIYYVNRKTAGNVHLNNVRNWSMTFLTPSVLVDVIPNQFDDKSLRVMLCQNHFQNYSDAVFNDFMHQVDMMSELFKGELSSRGEDVSKWQSNARSRSDGKVGVSCKIKDATLRGLIGNFTKAYQCVLKISCLYVGERGSGVGLEVIEMHDA